MIDLATRVYNHNFQIDPIVRSLLDTDFYKLLMAQSIFRRRRDARVTFGIQNRSKSVRLADFVDAGELREQLDHARTLTLSRGESTWLRGNTFYGQRQMFAPDFMDWLETFRLPEYELEARDGQYVLTFHGPWIETSMWEVPALSILNELRSRGVVRHMGKLELQVLYARAMTRVWEKIERLRALPDLSIADFGTRRRHGFLWQDWCVEAMRAGLGDRFLGTSNCLIALRREVEAVGTNAHELPMVYSALADGDEALARAPYDVLADWQQDYAGNLLVMLPDTYGTSGFLAHAPEWMNAWTGIRIDSKEPIAGGEEAIAWWRSRGCDPREKLAIFSDGLDVETIEAIHAHFHGRMRIGYGWGTLLTNDFRGLVPDGRLDPISIVCKVITADGRPTVKISDNPSKAIGPADQIARYRRVFAVADGPAMPVLV
ncbi:nicotinate phosphoribosyltransferase [Methylobacterium sp. Leaf469]|jgi:nicotinate phosphoribosyltransferase|uniref:nicotinate phosphoribosyltransferase n=1 Tax=unclassified Methylobacterium TaxID=2615210 RepID=UPI0006F4A853|nr:MULTISPECIES: nicotinate phosphoribosyltransferase [unclassified Methylobacterium]KQP24194.1 nicotinate phosphoribosyltransferase [Methylobacterium sp. Leaf100]KQP24468.1 nicotinate phosphoribosyltransferase [Methylobacterium sp. Leaf102]KQP60267.1 nicotinate phosphoribosyltransferase [Methylobacterium sp. Leaf112]KQT93048.1 nicotinate phosphoribosyltransferase [Methylobacterium sp. Leaf469]